MDDTFERTRAALAEHYELRKLLGRGGMAEVYLAQDLRHDRSVAVKVLRPDVAAQLGTERFLREVRVAAGLSHPHVLPLHDSGEAEGLLYYVMPCVEGESLAEHLAHHAPLPLEEAVRLGRGIAQALGHAHARGVVHRDVKPGNVLMSEGEPLLADFGLASSDVPQDLALTQAGDALGTPLTMSPEQAGGQPTDARSDVYSLGCVLFEMLTGRPPFHGASAAELFAHHRETKVPRLASLRADAPPALDQLVARCLAKRPDDRPANGEVVAEELDTILGTLRTGAVRVEGGRRMKRIVGVSALVVLVLGGVLFAVLRDRSRRAWVDEEALPALEAAMDASAWEDAMQLGLEIEAIVPDHPQLVSLKDGYSGEVELLSDPPGASVTRQPLDRAATGTDTGAAPVWIPLGVTPVTVRLPHGFHRLRFEKQGYRTSEIASHWYYLRGQTTRLAKPGEVPDDMVFVPGGRVALNIPGLDHLAEVELNNACLGRDEVTVGEYARFVEAGGYTDPQWWTEAFLHDGVTLSFEPAMQRLQDATGRPGPASWIAGAPPEGTARHPVTGVSWYEAAAYCAWAGRELPTIYHWNRAAETRLSAMVVPGSHFDGGAPADVGSYPALSAFGLRDMAGNAREWCSNHTSKGERAILGGGFDDLPYMFNDFFAADPWDRSPSNGFRTATYSEPPGASVTAAVDPPSRDFRGETPASDEVFAVYRDLYRYDPLPLDSEVLLRDEGHADYVAQRVAYTLPYGDERGEAWLYTPKRGDGPFPCAVIFPGSNAIHTDSSDSLVRSRFGWLMRQGYAVILPIYLATYERGTELKSDYPDESQRWRDHVVAWGKDMSRAIDYLEERLDCDADRLAYFGTSWGGAMGPIMVAIEPRFDAAALYVAGLLFQKSRPEVEAIHYAPRVTVPVVMLNGKYDHFFPVETSQRPLYDLLGTADDKKRYVLEEGGHFVPKETLVREVLAWFDEWVKGVGGEEQAKG